MVSTEEPLEDLITEAEKALEQYTTAQKRLYERLRQAPDVSTAADIEADTDVDTDADTDSDTDSTPTLHDFEGDLVEDVLSSWDGVGAAVGHRLWANDYKTVQDVAEATSEDLQELESVGPTLAEKMLDYAHEHLAADQGDVAAEIFACDECDREFDTEVGRNIHYGHSHETSDQLSEDIDEELGLEDDGEADDEGAFCACDDCGETFTSETGLSIHRGQVHDGDDEDTSTPVREDVATDGSGAVATSPDAAGNSSTASPEEPVRFRDYGASTGTDPYCQSCGNHVQKDYIEVMEPDSEPGARVCPHCEELIREGDGTIREARSTRGNRR